MQTAQIMIRDLRGLPVRQNHKTGMFNANDLLEIYNFQNPSSSKRLDHFLKTQSTQEYIGIIAKELNSEEAQTPDLSLPDLTFVNTPKKGNLPRPESVVKSSRGVKTGGTWMHPYLFIDFAMWLSPEFKLQCMKWLSDKLITFRDLAGDSFKDVNIALTIKCGDQRQISYIREAKMINGLVFGDDSGGQRNQASQEQLDMLNRLQKADIKLIYEGHSFDSRRKNLGIYKSLSE